jgi:hypothetical protein
MRGLAIRFAVKAYVDISARVSYFRNDNRDRIEAKLKRWHDGSLR